MPYENSLPKEFKQWFRARNWNVHKHQLDMISAAKEGKSALLIAPTGGGKTLAGFLPSLIMLKDGKFKGLHTLYISPLKALAADIKRNLMLPVEEMGLNISIDMRTGDTSNHKRQRQVKNPPNIILTTPESLEVLLSYPESFEIFKNLKRVIIDEVHALAPGKRGHLTSLCVSRLRKISPKLTVAGLSATVAEPEKLGSWLGGADVIRAKQTAKPEIHMLQSKNRIPWAGYMASYAVPDIYEKIKNNKTSIVFINTRAQAEWMFQQLWEYNTDGLAIALHHGSLEKSHRVRVEQMMAEGKLNAIVATASLDLGLDWGDVDMVIQVGAPKGISRLLQRVGRSNHQYNKPSRAFIVPTNRYETLEAIAVMNAIEADIIDGEELLPGTYDVLAQYIMNCACSGGFDADELFAEIKTAWPYRNITRDIFEQIIQFLINGGYALNAYDRFHRLIKGDDGKWMATPIAARRHRFNIGTIVEYEMLKIGLRRKNSPSFKDLGQIEEYFVQGLKSGDTFIFAGQMLKFLSIRDNRVEVERSKGERPKIPSFKGGRLPLSQSVINSVFELLEHEEQWGQLPDFTRSWLSLQKNKSSLPGSKYLLVETFPHEKLEYTVIYSLVGRNANQTFGLLLSYILEKHDQLPLGFIATDYALAFWSVKQISQPEKYIKLALSSEQNDEWINSSQMTKRAFRDVAIISGLVERRIPGKQKTGKQVTISTDLIYDVLMKYEPDHILIKATREDIVTRIANTGRLQNQLAPMPVTHNRLEKQSPLSVPMLLEIGIEKIKGKGELELLSSHSIELQREKEGDKLMKEITK